MERNMLAKEISNLFREHESSFLDGLFAPIDFKGLYRKTMQAEVTQAALDEWERWSRGQLTEDRAEAFPLLVKYWKEGNNLSDSNAKKYAKNSQEGKVEPGRYWSAAFVCYIMKKVYPSFPAVPAHMGYYEWALKNTRNKGNAPFFVFSPEGVEIEVGDIVLNRRAGGSHGNIVVKVANGKAEVVGGNVGNATSGNFGVTVNKKNLPLAANHILAEPGKYFAIIKLLPDRQGNRATPVPTTTATESPLNFAKQAAASVLAVALVNKGMKNPDAITDAIFYDLYPEQKGKRLEKGSEMAKYWIFLRENVVQSVLSDSKGINRSISTTNVSDTTVQKIINDSEIMEAFRHANKLTGVPIDYLIVFAYIESGGNKKIGTNKFGYTGLMQMGQSATRDVISNFPESISNGVSWNDVLNYLKINVLASAYYIKLNRKRLNKNIPDDALHTYLAHQQGAGGLNKLMHTLKTNTNAKANKNHLDNLPSKFIASKGGAENVTVNDFYEYWKKRVGNIVDQVKKYISV